MVVSVRYPDFEAYIGAVDTYLQRMCGKASSDFPDHDFRSDYADDLMPLEVALTVIYKLRTKTRGARPRRIA